MKNSAKTPLINFSQELAKQMITSMGVGVYTLDTQGNCTYVNEKGVDILGWTSDELLNINIHEKIHAQTANGEFLSREDCPTYKSILLNKVFYSENEVFKHKSGEIFPVLVVSEPLYKDEEKIGSVAIFKDISVHKNIEAELDKAKQQVNHINQLKNNFLANMSHELRTPLNAILGLSQLALQTDLSPNQQSYLNKIEESSTQLSTMINDILDLSKIDSGKMELATSSFNINSLFSDLKKQFQPLFIDKNIDLIFTIDPSVKLNRYGDPSKIKKVLMSLLQNALKFTNSGQVLLTVTLGASLNQIIFNVIDSGIGLSEEQIKNLFIDFDQADSSASRKYEGMGLGLNYSKKLVDLMHGELGVTSTLNEGSHFFVKLNLDIAKFVESKSNEAQQPHILLAEDNKINQTIVKNLLSKQGCLVEVCENGQQAIDQVSNHPYSLVLMDIQMPIMDGIEATQLIRKNEDFKKLPIIALTGNTSEPEKQACLDSGMNDFLSKPVKPEGLLLVLKKWTDCFIQNQSKSTEKLHPSEPKEILTAVEGIDIQQGLQRLANNTILYKQLLNDFCVHYIGYDIQIKSLLEIKNFPEAERFAHSIKGVAGNIGANTLASISGQLENSIKLAIDTNEPLANFKQALDQLHLSLNESGYGVSINKINANNEKQNKKKASKNSQEKLKQLKIKLQAYDGDTEDALNDSLEILTESYLDGDLQQLKLSIQRFSFDEALLIIEKLLAS